MLTSGLLLLLGQLAVAVLGAPAVAPVSVIDARESITTLSTEEVTAFKPYTWFAAAAHCPPAETLAWNCTKCGHNDAFVPIASGGDGAFTQYWFVGWDTVLKTIIVAYQGTDLGKIIPIFTDINFVLKPLRVELFPGISTSLKTHGGFADAHAKSAKAVLAAVKSGIAKYGATEVTLTGHSLGGAIAVISTAHLSINLPTDVNLRTITYSAPRVGNQDFIDFVNSRSVIGRVVNKKDPVPTLPGRFMGFAQTEGEIHIVDSGEWKNCPGQDNTNAECSIGYVPNLFVINPSDHVGPFDGVTLGSC